MTDAAAAGLGLEGVGFEHSEEYPDVGRIQGRVLDIGDAVGDGVD